MSIEFANSRSLILQLQTVWVIQSAGLKHLKQKNHFSSQDWKLFTNMKSKLHLHFRLCLCNRKRRKSKLLFGINEPGNCCQKDASNAEKLCSPFHQEEDHRADS